MENIWTGEKDNVKTTRKLLKIYKSIPPDLVDEAKILIKNDMRVSEKLKNIYNVSGYECWSTAIEQLRRHLRAEGRGNVSYIMLEKMYKSKNYDEMIKLLEERFLCPVLKQDIDFMYKYIKDVDRLKDLYTYAETGVVFLAAVMEI